MTLGKSIGLYLVTRKVILNVLSSGYIKIKQENKQKTLIIWVRVDSADGECGRRRQETKTATRVRGPGVSVGTLSTVLNA